MKQAILTTKKDQITRRDKESLIRSRYEECIVASVEKSDVGEKILPANGKVRIKKNYKPKANDKGKENNAIFFEFLAEFIIK